MARQFIFPMKVPKIAVAESVSVMQRENAGTIVPPFFEKVGGADGVAEIQKNFG